MSLDSLGTVSSLSINGEQFRFFSLAKAAQKLQITLSELPYSLRVLLENVLRNEDGRENNKATFDGFAEWVATQRSSTEIGFYPARVLMQDFTGVPAVVDLAAMRDAVTKFGGNPKAINPLIPVDLVIDHSVQVDHSGNSKAFAQNVELEMQRNIERYAFLKWGQNAFSNFRVVPPGTGICHQVNLEYLSEVIFEKEGVLGVDSLVGTDSHTTMVNGLSVLGWGVGGIEAEAAMLGQALSMVLPEVVGVNIKGQLREGITATDLVLTITHLLRKTGVVGKFVEFFGEGIRHLSLADRATIANMAPEYGATCGFFPIDEETLKYLALTGRGEKKIAIVEEYAKAQSLWYNVNSVPKYTITLELDLATIEPSLAGPKRPQDRIALSTVASNFVETSKSLASTGECDLSAKMMPDGKDYTLSNGAVVLAAITSCTNTSNPSVLIAAGLLAQKAVKLGLKAKPWVKTSLAPGSQVVSEYLNASGLTAALNELGFFNVGYGCTTCIGNSGPLDQAIEQTISNNNMVVCSVLSGNRNFEGRVHPLIRANYLASPPLVVAYALLGYATKDITTEPIGIKDGKNIYLADIWPSAQEINDYVAKFVQRNMFITKYNDVFKGDNAWQQIAVTTSDTYNWDTTSTYINNPPYFTNMAIESNGTFLINNARLLCLFGDSITTDHISPAGNIARNSAAAKYLEARGVSPKDFNSYGARRGNHEVMMRGTFANTRIKNLLCNGVEGGYAIHQPSGEQMFIYDAAMRYMQEQVPLIIMAGKEYGTGSSRDWAAKGTALLGVKAVIAGSFERIHRSNLVGMGVLPFTFVDTSVAALNLNGIELFDIEFDKIATLGVKSTIPCTIKRPDNHSEKILLRLEVYTEVEIEYLKNGGILHKMVRQLSHEEA